MKQVTIENVKKRIARIENGESVMRPSGMGLSMQHEFELACLRELVAVTEQLHAVVAELSSVEAVHNEAVFITDEDYDKCPKRVQGIIRHLAIMQIPAYQDFVAELRAEGETPLIKALLTIANSEQIDGDTVVCDFDTLVSVAAGALSQYFAAQIRQSVQVKGVKS